MSYTADNSESFSAADETDDGMPDAFVLDRESQPQRVAQRLQAAIDAAGGKRDVSSRSGVEMHMLNRFLKGQVIKQPALVALADACYVSVDWLATGRGAKEKIVVRGFSEPSIDVAHNSPPDAPIVVAKWPRLDPADARMISAAVSLAHTAVYNKDNTVDAGLFISALDELYGAFTRPGLDDASRAAEIAHTADKYRRLAEKVYGDPAPKNDDGVE